MKAEIIAVGTELLMGQIANTDAQFISKELNELGIDVFYHHVVGDNTGRLKDLLKMTLNRSDIIITTGGIGPTQDDLTKETIAEFLNLEMIEDVESSTRIKEFFKSINRKITDNNIKQAFFPKGATVLENGKGTAPGCILEIQDKTIIVLPGPPRELNHMFKIKVKPYLSNKTDYIIKSKMIKVFGIGEASLEDMLLEYINKQTNPTLATYATSGQVTLRVTAKAKDEIEADELLKPIIEQIEKKLGDHIFSLNDESMAEVVYRLLLKDKMKVAFAESCTGGMLSSMLIDIPGSSEVMDMSVVCYSNESKNKMLNVKNETLDEYGAVSKQTVYEMAEGMLKLSNADISLAISGIAGPDGGTEAKPVGLIYICLHDGVNTYYRKLNFARDRNYNRHYACLQSLDMIRHYLEKKL